MTAPIDDTTIEAIGNDICFISTLFNLGRNLGYDNEALDFYRKNNYDGGKTTYQGTKEMLRDWTRKTPPEEQRSKLWKALEDANLGSLAMEHFPDVDEQQTQQQPGVANTISASDSSNVSGNTMIGEQTNVYNQSAPSAPVVHHHHTTHVKQAAPAVRPIFIQPSAQKRQATPSPAPPPKRPKVTHARPSTSKATTSKRKKSTTSKPKSTAHSKKATSKKKSQTAPNAPKKRVPKTAASSKKNSQRKKQTVKKKKPPKPTKPKLQQRARSKSKPKKSKKK